jgi:hypothetical protein
MAAVAPGRGPFVPAFKPALSYSHSDVSADTWPDAAPPPPQDSEGRRGSPASLGRVGPSAAAQALRGGWPARPGPAQAFMQIVWTQQSAISAFVAVDCLGCC